MIHTCPICNNVTSASGINVEFSKFAKFCKCGGIDGLRAEIKRLQMELDASCNAEELRLVREENERLHHEIAALKKRVDKPLGA